MSTAQALDEEELRSLVGHDVVDADGRSIGYVEYIFTDRETRAPEWIGVITGTFRHHHVLVPVAGATRSGTSLRVPWRKEQVKRAPSYDKDEKGGLLGLAQYRLEISPEKERRAYAHYGIERER
jgi:sporulation protein YlmC with PRC-barrel domain